LGVRAAACETARHALRGPRAHLEENAFTLAELPISLSL
jgi:hypothetical protein